MSRAFVPIRMLTKLVGHIARSSQQKQQMHGKAAAVVPAEVKIIHLQTNSGVLKRERIPSLKSNAGENEYTREANNVAYDSLLPCAPQWHSQFILCLCAFCFLRCTLAVLSRNVSCLPRHVRTSASLCSVCGSAMSSCLPSDMQRCHYREEKDRASTSYTIPRAEAMNVLRAVQGRGMSTSKNCRIHS
jgi:hypothetical protein